MRITHNGRTGIARLLFDSIIVINWDGGGFTVLDTWWS